MKNCQEKKSHVSQPSRLSQHSLSLHKFQPGDLQKGSASGSRMSYGYWIYQRGQDAQDGTTELHSKI